MITAKAFTEQSRYPIDHKWGYIMGTRGQVWTQAAQNATTDAMAKKYGQQWVGKHVSDCSGLVKWCLIQLGANCPHGSNSIWRSSLSEKGEVKRDTVLQDGMLVFKYRKDKDGKDDWYHVGVYDGGYVNQAQSTQTGCKRTEMNSGWTHWGKLKCVKYTQNDADDGNDDGDDTVMQDMMVKCNPGETVNLRKQPSRTSVIIAKIPNGEIVSAGEDNNGWRFVVADKSGYMMSDFLVPANTPKPDDDVIPEPDPDDDIPDVEMVTVSIPYDMACTLRDILIDAVGMG